MKRGTTRNTLTFVTMLLWTSLSVWLSFASEESKGRTPAADAPKAEAPAAAPTAPVAPAAGAPAPKLPPYFTATSPDPKTTLWPDPTGANSGVWATPAGDGKGDI